MKIAPDKKRHFFAAIPMGIIFQMLANWIYSPPVYQAVLIALAGVIAVSYGFELFSMISGMGIYDIMDAVYSIVGGVLGQAVVLLYVLFKN